jgi:tagatose-1,6-bisphosphate aldolase
LAVAVEDQEILTQLAALVVQVVEVVEQVVLVVQELLGKVITVLLDMMLDVVHTVVVVEVLLLQHLDKLLDKEQLIQFLEVLKFMDQVEDQEEHAAVLPHMVVEQMLVVDLEVLVVEAQPHLDLVAEVVEAVVQAVVEMGVVE